MNHRTRFIQLLFVTTRHCLLAGSLIFVSLGTCEPVAAQQEMLETRLRSVDVAELADRSERLGNAARGALLFYRPELNCIKCHEPRVGDQGQVANPLGPELEKLGEEYTADKIINSLLNPSAEIREGFETITLTDLDGRSSNVLLESIDDTQIVYRDVDLGSRITVSKDELDDWQRSSVSIMPEGLVNQLASEQEFLDLVQYVRQIAAGGAQAKLELKPAGVLTQLPPLPEYESRVDHRGLIEGWNADSLARGAETYRFHCQSCHGSVDEEGSMPTSLRFAQGQFKKGGDPLTMYNTLTHGYSMMIAQRWMVPRQKYDVIHYIREQLIKPHNAAEYFEVTDDYLAQLPVGDTLGPEPVLNRPWQQMNYGPNMMGTFEVGDDASNIAYKGLAVQLDQQPGGIGQGRFWMLYEHDTMRVAAAWSGTEFIDWEGIHFDGQHNRHPHIAGQVHFANPQGPGWADPRTGQWNDNRQPGRDGRLYGPLDRDWMQYLGRSQYGNKTILHYRVGETHVMEMPGLDFVQGQPVFQRVLNLGPRTRPLELELQELPAEATWVASADAQSTTQAILALSGDANPTKPLTQANLNGNNWFQVDPVFESLDTDSQDYTIWCRFRTRDDGTLVASAPAEGDWAPDGKTLFIRDGRLAFDIGWVGAVQGRKRVTDGKWHEAAVTWRARDGRVRLFIDGKLDRSGELMPEGRADRHVLKFGFTNDNFPARSRFTGTLSQVAIAQEELSDEQVAKFDQPVDSLVASWELMSAEAQSETAPASVPRTIVDTISSVECREMGSDSTTPSLGNHAVIAVSTGSGAKIVKDPQGQRLLLKIPAGDEALRVVVYQGRAGDADAANQLANELPVEVPAPNLEPFCQGGPPLWPAVSRTRIETRFEQGGFAVDYLLHPDDDPSNPRLRLTGLDFFADGDRCAVSSWDGNVWLVTGILGADGDGLTWRKIASGLFQPLGLKIVEDEIFVSCRDQIVKLHDRNRDGETDFYECFNSDHQVTEHFHEFAMGLQRDGDGNFYYAKSARHAKKPLVPHHGTLLKVSPDGKRTEIVAVGFRAANGVCINPDGSFIVTDQEGHWNPKNRINWVETGGFYGNMWGYHDVTDSSDAAMEPPLCWITNSFDRSPAELMWVDGPARWGPLNGSLLNFSYGYGKIYVVPFEKVGSLRQGGMCELPIPQFPTGIMRGRFSPRDGQLYCCGMFAWSSTQTRPGGLYRVRYTGESVQLPVELKAARDRLEIGFSDKLAADSVADTANFSIKSWHIKRSANYGSQHFDETNLEIESASLSEDGTTVVLRIPDLQPTRCMSIKYSLRTHDGQQFTGTIHNTIHRLPE